MPSSKFATQEVNHPAISVVIPTFNRVESLQLTLQSLVDQSLPKKDYEVIIVNDGSSDATPEVCKKFAGQMQLVSLRHAENSGISAAKNTGILSARGRIVLFFDDDDLADRLLLEEHLKAHEQHPAENVAVLGYTTWAPTLPVTPLLKYLTEIGRFLFAYGELKNGQILDFTYFWGGRSSCKRSFLAKHGVFNRQFRSIIEDMELGYRLSHFGFRVVFHRPAVSYMARAIGFEDFCKRCERQGEALYLFGRLHPDPVVQQYCQLPDPFIDNRAVAVDPEARWPEVAALFHEKISQAGRVERLLKWGFEPKPGPRSTARGSTQMETYERQMSELFASLQSTANQVADLEQHLSDQQQSYEAELERRHARYKAREQRYHAGQMQLHEHVRELDRVSARLRDQLAEASELLQRKSITLAEQEQAVGELTSRLRRQLLDTRKLAHLLDDAEEAAARLRSSRRWMMANPIDAIRARLSGRKAIPGYRYLEKIVAAYLKWRKSRPELAQIDHEITRLAMPGVPTQPIVDLAPGSVGVLDKTVRVTVPVPSIPIESLHFVVSQSVQVSIIIPVFNQFLFTHACLASLQSVKEQAPFEVILVDDCSTDKTAELISKISGMVYMRNETNTGFIASCNRGASGARAEYLMFLNNDTIVTNGWLTGLLDTFSAEPKAGVVGSKLVYPDGRLQEAGGIIWQDASGWNYGKFDDPQKPKYNYLREVDYCSAAALMIPKALFDSVGGFDTRYAPAYYEDTDLCFKVHNEGYRVFYQPLSQVIHYEGATGGTDISTGTKKHQEVNRSVFAQRWAAELSQKPQVGDVAQLQQPPAERKRILVIDHYVPMPDRDSGSVRMSQILRLLHQLGHRVTFIPDNLANSVPYTGDLQKRGIEVWYHPYIEGIREYLSLHGSEFDVIILSRCDFAGKHIDDVRLYAPQSRVIFDTVDLHFVREDRQARVTSDASVLQQARERERQERALVEKADETWVVSDIEQRLLQRSHARKSIQVVSNIVEISRSETPFALRRDWLFIGSFQHTPNIDAMVFFLREIYPLLKERLAGSKFYIIGEKVPPEVVSLATGNVIVTGVQPDVRPFFDSAKLSIAPLRYGAGVKGKINQSMAYGIPVVATSLAIEGMELTPGEDILVADEPEPFAEAMVRLYESEKLWNRLSENGIKQTKERYSVEAALKRLSHLFGDEHLKSLAMQSRILTQGNVAMAAKG